MRRRSCPRGTVVTLFCWSVAALSLMMHGVSSAQATSLDAPALIQSLANANGFDVLRNRAIAAVKEGQAETVWTAGEGDDMAATAEPGESMRASPDVDVREVGDTIVMDNGKIRLVVDRRNGSVLQLFNEDGLELMGGGWSYVNGHFSAGGRDYRWTFGNASYSLKKASPDIAHIAFHRDADPEAPFSMTLHYVLRRGDSGVYWYLTVGHSASDETVDFSFLRRVTRISGELFTHAALSDGRVVRLPTPAEQSEAQEIMDATLRLADGSVYTKYDFAAAMGDYQFHGAMGDGVGLWSISASNEYHNGGPTKQYNTIHAAGSTHALLNVLQSVHFLGNVRMRAAGDWTKVYGPILLYVNRGATREELWEDAKRRADFERAAWPHSWVDEPSYPLERGAVSGRLTFPDGEGAGGAWVVLGAKEPEWQRQSDGYLFWTRADSDGAFVLPHARPGEYALYAFRSGTLGEFRLDGLEVIAGSRTDLGELVWTPDAHGRLLWEIGVPDRSAGEFWRGDQHRQWGLWRHYGADFPDGVRFVVGQSDWRRDWNYLQPVKVFAPDGSGHLRDAAPWEIVFALDQAQVGRSTLTVAIAGSSEAILHAAINGVGVGTIALANDSSIHRGGNRGYFRQERLVFDAALLQEGVNRLQLRVEGRGHYAGVMYDYLRLEVDDGQRE